MPSDVSKKAMSLLERFVVLMYDRTTNIMEVNDARKQLFAQNSRDLSNTPPTQPALRQHCRRAFLRSTAGIRLCSQVLTYQAHLTGQR